MSFFKFLIILYVLGSQIKAIEIRAIIDDPLNIHAALMHEQATYQGDYAFNDYIYSNRDSKVDLNDEFFRIREYEKTRWKQKLIVAVHKVRNPQGECHKILFEGEYDTLAEAQQQIPMVFSKKCSFFRRGWEYHIESIRIFVEEIDGLPPSVEMIAKSQEEILSLFDKIKIVSILTDSVPQWYCNQMKAHYQRLSFVRRLLRLKNDVSHDKPPMPMQNLFFENWVFLSF